MVFVGGSAGGELEHVDAKKMVELLAFGGKALDICGNDFRGNLARMRDKHDADC